LFINAGDGKHEHPTQEMLDEFTFLEQNNWDTSSIHIALVGDLLHGRTVHSKVDGLKIFDTVRVDCIAPSEIAMPETYIHMMKTNGYEIRLFSSLDAYFAD
jgi:aspartate carbamoyltransferase